MIQSLNHIQPSEPLSQDFEEFVDRASRSSTYNNSPSSHEVSPAHDNEYSLKLQQWKHQHHPPSQERITLYQIPIKATKSKDLNLNKHRKQSHHVQNQLKNVMFHSNSIPNAHEREESRESVASSNSSIETPHYSTADEDEKNQSLFAKQIPVTTTNTQTPALSNISTSTTLRIMIFDRPDTLKKVSISIRPNDTTNDVISAVILKHHVHSQDIQHYELFYYDDGENEIADYLPPLARNEIVASKGIEVLAMKWIDHTYFEYHVQSESQTNCILGIDKDRMLITGPSVQHFSYAFDVESITTNAMRIGRHRWMDGRLLQGNIKEKKEYEGSDIFIIESIANVGISDNDDSVFEINVLLDMASSRSSRSSTIEFIDAGDYKPDNYAQLWNPMQIIPRLQEIAAAQNMGDADEVYDSNRNAHTCGMGTDEYTSYTLKYWAGSEQECREIVKKIKHLVSLQNK